MITLDQLDREILAAFAAGVTEPAIARRTGRPSRTARALHHYAHGDRTRAGELVRIYDQLATAPVRELSPTRLPGRAVAVAGA